MAVQRDHPYAQFNFLVDIGVGDTLSVEAGFSEVSGLDAHLDVIEYRTGNSRSPEPMKLTGLSRVGDVTLRRGLIGSLNLWRWFAATRSADPEAVSDVTIRLQDERHDDTVLTWKLSRARPIRHVSGPLLGAGTDVAIEELVLGFERLDLE